MAILAPTAPAAVEVTSDASGHWDCRAWSQHRWFQYQWPEEALHFHIAFKELFALVMAYATWGHEWCGSQVKCWCDNEAAVWAIQRQSCRDPALMHLLRCVFFLEAHYQFELVAVHIAGVRNDLADDLSRNRLPSFFSNAPHMDPLPAPIPPPLPLLLLASVTWTSPAWTMQFTAIITGGLQSPHTVRTGRP